jgi:rare lipoprotein A
MSGASLRSLPGFGVHPAASSPTLGNTCRSFALALAAATLVAYAQSSTTTGKFVASTTSRQAERAERERVSTAAAERAEREPVSTAAAEHVNDTQRPSFGLASSYGEGSKTASGERFNANELTAAHRTLPFGTRVRVTNRSNGRSVVVTINDRGPFVKGRVIDVTPAAARVLGMTGLAPVTVQPE